MTPRPTALKTDATASHFLDAAAQLIDAMFVTSPDDRPRRLRSIKFPAALDWLRVQDVVDLAQDQHGLGASRKAFHNRWKYKELFIRDAVIHTMFYRDQPEANPGLQSVQLAGIVRADSISEAIIGLCDGLLDSLLAHPRSFLLLHIGPLLDQHPALRSAVIEDMLTMRAPWYQGYGQLLRELGVSLRPGWTPERMGLALQAMLDGFVMRSRLQHEEMAAMRWQQASLFADSVIAFTLGVVDVERSMRSAREALDHGLG